MKRTDKLLWARWRRERRQDAFTDLVRPHLRFAVDYARRIGCSPADADDVVQQSLTSLLEEQTDRPVDVGIRAWLGRSVSLQARMARRSAARRHRREQLGPRPRGESISTIERRDEVDRALEALPDNLREAVVLRYLHDMEYREVAHVLGISENACRLRVHRGLESLRDRMGNKPEPMIAMLPLLAGAGMEAPWPTFPAATGTAVVAGTGAFLMKKWIVAGLVAAVAAIGFVASTAASDAAPDTQARGNTDDTRHAPPPGTEDKPDVAPSTKSEPEKAASPVTQPSARETLAELVWAAGGSVSDSARSEFAASRLDRPFVVGARWIRKEAHAPEVITGIRLHDANLDAVLPVLLELGSVHWLALSTSEVADSHLEQLSTLSELDGLRIGRTKVSDEGMPFVARMSALQRLSLHNTKVTDKGLEHLTALPRLKHLDIHDLPITDEGLKHVGRMSVLESLQLGETRITDEGFRHLGDLPGLVHLDLSDARVTGAGVRHLRLDRLTSFTGEESSHIDDRALESLRAAKALRLLNLEETAVTDKGVEHLANHTKLEYLHIGGTRVTSEGVTHLAGLASLRILVLDETSVDDKAIDAIGQCRALRVLRIKETGITKAGAERLRALLPQCEIRWE